MYMLKPVAQTVCAIRVQGRIKLLGGPVPNVDGGPCPVLPLSRSVCPTLPYPSHRHAPL